MEIEGDLSTRKSTKSDGNIGFESGTPEEKLDRVVMSIARLIGRRIAREEYEKALRSRSNSSLSKKRKTRNR